jgi:hypothetical protein
MQNINDIQFVGKHAYIKENALVEGWNKTFSLGIFKWELKKDGKSMKKGKTIVRVSGLVAEKEKVFNFADNVVDSLNKNDWDGRKYVLVK